MVIDVIEWQIDVRLLCKESVCVWGGGGSGGGLSDSQSLLSVPLTESSSSIAENKYNNYKNIHYCLEGDLIGQGRNTIHC